MSGADSTMNSSPNTTDNTKPTKIKKQIISYNVLSLDQTKYDQVFIRKNKYAMYDSWFDMFNNKVLVGTFYDFTKLRTSTVN